MRIFDVNGGKVVGRVLRRTTEGFVLEWAAMLSFEPIPRDGGKRFEVQAALMPFVPCLPNFTLMETAIRGYAEETGAWLPELYARFVARAERGEFHLNPYAPLERVALQQGDGAVEAETAPINVVMAAPAPTSTPVTPPPEPHA